MDTVYVYNTQRTINDGGNLKLCVDVNEKEEDSQ